MRVAHSRMQNCAQPSHSAVRTRSFDSLRCGVLTVLLQISCGILLLLYHYRHVGWAKITRIINKKRSCMPQRHSWQCWKYLVIFVSRLVTSVLCCLLFVRIFGLISTYPDIKVTKIKYVSYRYPVSRVLLSIEKLVLY
jgi:hypothetical protein